MLLPANSCSGPQRVLFFLSCWTTHYYFTRGWSGNFGTHVWTSRWVSVFCAQLGSFYKLLIWSSFSRKQSKNIMNSFKQRKLKLLLVWCHMMRHCHLIWPDGTRMDLNEPECFTTSPQATKESFDHPRYSSSFSRTAMALRASSGAIRETPLAFRVSWVWA